MSNLSKPIFSKAPNRHYKSWGYEDWIINNDLYCGKILHFDAGAKFSSHFHLEKHETWFIYYGKLELNYINTSTAENKIIVLETGKVITIPPGCPHQLRALAESVIFEVSTPHKESDSYRIAPGDSQLKPLKNK